jgi:hypothetical protein
MLQRRLSRYNKALQDGQEIPEVVSDYSYRARRVTAASLVVCDSPQALIPSSELQAAMVGRWIR